MQGLWYGDRRDRIKWGALVHLSKRFGLASIFQVAYFRNGFERILRTDQGTVEIAESVWNHFADLTTVESLSDVLGVQIRVYTDVFDPRKRQEYAHGVLQAIMSQPRPRLLFLDPDTGIQPNVLEPEHLSLDELTNFWNGLDANEVLAVYQHAPHERDWIDRSIHRMANACGGTDVRSIQGSVAGDVAILWSLRHEAGC